MDQTNDSVEPISCRAYAKHRNVTPMAVSLAIKTGRLSRSVVRDAMGSPKIASIALADQEWEANTDHTRSPQRAEPLPEVESSDVAGAAARAKHWEAKLRELKFKEASGELVSAADVKREWVSTLAQVRSKLLTIPTLAKQAIPALTIANVERLEQLVRDALEDLIVSEAKR